MAPKRTPASRAAASCGATTKQALRRLSRDVQGAFNFRHPIDHAGIGRYAMWSSLLSTILFVGLALYANQMSNQMERRVAKKSIELFAGRNWRNVCVGGSVTYNGTMIKGGPLMLCFGGGGGGKGLKEPLDRRVLRFGSGGGSNVDDRKEMLAVLATLDKCHAIRGMYRVSEYGNDIKDFWQLSASARKARGGLPWDDQARVREAFTFRPLKAASSVADHPDASLVATRSNQTRLKSRLYYEGASPSDVSLFAFDSASEAGMGRSSRICSTTRRKR